MRVHNSAFKILQEAMATGSPLKQFSILPHFKTSQKDIGIGCPYISILQDRFPGS